MKPSKLFWLGLIASLLITPICRAQLPGAAPAVPGAAGGAAGVGGVGGAPAPAAPTSNLWSFLCPTADQKAACKACFCNSGIGQLVSSAAGPFSLMSGGLIQNRCAQNAILNDLNKPADDPSGVAARVKADEEDAKARRANVRFLGTVDCNYWPEAIDALKLALRKDRNECVRFEAALALRNGCCCNKEIIMALQICIIGSDADGFPKERSDRVRAAAADALTRCPLMYEESRKEDKQKVVDAGPVDPTDFYKKVSLMPNDKVVSSAKAILASMHGTPAASDGSSPAVAPVPAIHQRAGSLSGIVTNAFAPETASGGTRQPFFSGLTKALTGKQEYGTPVRQETAPVAPVATPTPVVIPTPTPIQTPPTPAPNKIIKIRETPTITPVQMVPALPPEPMPMPTKGITMNEPRPLEVIPTLPPEPMPMRNINIRERTVNTVETPIPGTESTVIRPREVKQAAPIEIVSPPPPPPTPSSEQPSLGQPREAKAAAAPVEIVQPTAPSGRTPIGPRETRGVVTIEIMPPMPAQRN